MKRVRLETQSEMHCEGDGIRGRTIDGPIERDREIGPKEVSFEKAALSLNGPTVVHQGRKPPIRATCVERQSCSRRPAVSQAPYKAWMNKDSRLPRRSCVYKWDKLQIERHAAASLEGDTHRKSNRKLICR